MCVGLIFLCAQIFSTVDAETPTGLGGPFDAGPINGWPSNAEAPSGFGGGMPSRRVRERTFRFPGGLRSGVWGRGGAGLASGKATSGEAWAAHKSATRPMESEPGLWNLTKP